MDCDQFTSGACMSEAFEDMQATTIIGYAKGLVIISKCAG